MRIPLAQLTDEQIHVADVVAAIDPARWRWHEVLDIGIPTFTPPGRPSREVRVLEIAVDSSNDDLLSTARERVRRVRGLQSAHSS